MENLKTRTTGSNSIHPIPSFFKILLDDSNPNLPLPTAFVKKQFLDGKFPENPVLESEFGGKWKVGIEKIGGKFCFVNGWLQFVEDTKTEVGDFLVFWLIGKSTFKVSIFGPNACAKVLKFATPNHCSCSCSRSGKSNSDLMNEIKIEEEDDEKKIEEDDDEKKIEEEDDVDEDEEEDDVDEDEVEDEDEVMDEVKNDYDFKEDTDEDDTESESDDDDEDDYDNEDELKEIKVQQFDSKEECLNPSFKRVLTKSHMFVLNLPRWFVKEARLENKEKIVIRNKEMKKWSVKIGRRTSGVYHFACGWVSFWKQNNLTEEDTCFFKYFHGENGSNGFIEVEVVKKTLFFI